MNIVTGVFDNIRMAEDTVKGLRDKDYDASDIGVVATDRDKGTALSKDMHRDYVKPGSDNFTSDDHVYNTLPNAFSDAIRNSNLPDEAVTWYDDRLHEGDVLVIVRTGDRMDDAERVIHDHGGWVYGEERHIGRMQPVERMEPVRRTERMAPEGEIHVPIVDEELVAERGTHQVGEVRVTRERTTETRDFPTTVTHEEIRVERRPLDHPISPNEYKGMDVPESGTIRIPIVEDEIRLVKRPIIREELVVIRTPVSEQKTIRETVTHTEPHVETTGGLHVEGLSEEERMRRGMPPTSRTETTGPMTTEGLSEEERRRRGMPPAA